jgi:hypothetical protein
MNGKYGQHCGYYCGVCLKSEQCHHVNGTCLKGCDAGYTGMLCQGSKLLWYIFAFMFMQKQNNCYCISLRCEIYQKDHCTHFLKRQ